MSRRLRILLIDDPEHALFRALRALLTPHDVEVAQDALDAIHRIDCAVRHHDVIFCDAADGELPGPLLWAYLSIGRAAAAHSMVLVARGIVRHEARMLVARVPVPCVHLPSNRKAIDALVARLVAAKARAPFALDVLRSDERPRVRLVVCECEEVPVEVEA